MAQGDGELLRVIGRGRVRGPRVVSTGSPYPMVAEASLAPVQRRPFRVSRRHPGELPARPPGAVYVFTVGGRVVPYGRTHLNTADTVVVDATEVYVVDMWPRLVAVDIVLASSVPANDHTVRITFRCQVTDPAEVATAGLSDLPTVLAGHLGEDNAFARGLDRTDVHTLRRTADAHVRAYCMVAPPAIGGMEITLVNVEVLTAEQVTARELDEQLAIDDDPGFPAGGRW